MSEPMKAAAVRFVGSRRLYDYTIPEGMVVNPGDSAMVDSIHGRAKVIVVDVKPYSDKARKPLLSVEPYVAEQQD